MAWIRDLGVVIDDDLLEMLRRAEQECRIRCTDAERTCDNACTITEPSEILQYWACLSSCFAAWLDCRDRCRVDYRNRIRFNGNPPNGYGNPESYYQQWLKDASREAIPYFRWTGVAFALTGGVLRFATPINPAIGGAGQLIAILGTLMTMSSYALEQVANDPLSEEYTEIYESRRFSLSEFVPISEATSGFVEDFAPLISHTLSTLSFLEAAARTMDRALYARSVNDKEFYFRQLRVSQGYSAACASALRSTQQARLRAAERFDSLRLGEEADRSPEDQQRELEKQDRVWRALMAAGLNPPSLRPEGRQIIVSYSDANEVMQRWREEGLDDILLMAINLSNITSEETGNIVNQFLSWVPSQDEFNLPLSKILEAPAFMGLENSLANNFERWGNYNVS